MFIYLKKCPICGREVEPHGGSEKWKPMYSDPDSGGDPYHIDCDCGLNFSIGCCDYSEFQDAWNNRVEEDYNQLDIKIGDKRFCVVHDYPKYIVKYGTCKKISKHNNNSTKYTFKMDKDYNTYTFTPSSFGKKVFMDLKSAEKVAEELNNKINKGDL